MQAEDPRAIKVRPIISAVDGPSDRVSWFLSKLLSPLTDLFHAHFSNAFELLNVLRVSKFEECYYESLDVEALYTNVDCAGAVRYVTELLEDSSLPRFGLSISDIKVLLTACLKCNIFRFEGQYYKQLRGLAMGNRLAPLLAVAFMDRIERNSLSRNVILYKRYIDDILIITKTRESLEEVFHKLHQDDIRLTREMPSSDGWLSFLNFAIRISQGNFESKWFRKVARKDIIINFRSAHPHKTKIQTIRNMINTAKDVSSGPYKDDSRNKALKIVFQNGYDEESLHVRFRSTRYYPNAPCLRIPYITENFSVSLQHIFLKYGMTVNIVANAPRTLRQLLVRSRLYDNFCNSSSCPACVHDSGICQIKGAVYRVRCSECGQDYIGETGRPLSDRIKEHLADLNHWETRNKPWSVHRNEKHGAVRLKWLLAF